MNAAIRSILLPTRFSLLSRRAAEHIVLLVSKFRSEVHMIHVIEHVDLLINPPGPGNSIPMPVPGTAPSELITRADERLKVFAEEVFGDLAPSVRLFSAVGGIADEIVKHAQRQAIDLIVMGTHSDGLLKRLVFGSVGRDVLERAPCPMLLVPVRDAGS